ncbi:hypothetical protein T11_7837 [Trichinella zimbabwensis]|uniref:Uncharacterized protein n=1 Tax=Trichinella zimbabwensis TaxID=268475 RepID=A0A0V1GBL5_9BILA|nr:hypothetical protein T11_7837 [Trichinella zimbabwensis]
MCSKKRDQTRLQAAVAQTALLRIELGKLSAPYRRGTGQSVFTKNDGFCSRFFQSNPINPIVLPGIS